MYAPSVKESFGVKMGDWFRHILSCFDREEDEEERPALQISAPTNFRREDISIPGLDPEQQHFIRTKAIADAQRLYAHLQPLRSSPSGHFASPNSPNREFPTYEEFTTPRSATSPTTPHSRTSHASGGRTSSTLERVKRHSRKISNSFTKPLGSGGYHAVGSGFNVGGTKYEMRSLMDPSQTRVVSPITTEEKLSGESFSVGGSEQEYADSGKGMMKL